MVARSFGTICSLLLVWLCALGASPASHSAPQSAALRSAAELALGDVATTPIVVTRALVAGTATSRGAERDVVSPLSWFAAPRRVEIQRAQQATRRTIDRQALAHASRPRRRTHDPAAPPALSRIAR
jgi:hypothetical protein